MILFGFKREEYREVKPYWGRIFLNGIIKIKGKYYSPTDVDIVFSNGYRKDRPWFRIKCKGLVVGGGLERWGAVPGKCYHVLMLGDITEVDKVTMMALKVQFADELKK